MNKGRLALVLFLTLTVIVLVWYFFFGGSAMLGPLVGTPQANGIIDAIISMVIIAVIYIVFKIGSAALKSSIMKSKGATKGENKMVQSVVKFVMLFVAMLVIFAIWVSFGTMESLILTFGGMFLGWSLQAPISGIAAWILVGVVRPFRIGDRVQLPQYGLVGDVVSISPLYTTLNQVGGSVGSEEPANRTILIPNAMLFSNLVINYTPKNQDELIACSAERMGALKPATAESGGINIYGSTYMLDEFVLRLSFDSDWDEAERILLDSATEVTSDIIQKSGQQPYIRADQGDYYGIFMRLRYLTDATQRPYIMYQIQKLVFKKVQANPKVDLAIPYIYSYRKGKEWAPPFSMDRHINGNGNGEDGLPPVHDDPDPDPADGQADAPSDGNPDE